jgi:hypothetical protein
MLSSVPSQYLVGLGSVVLTSTETLSRKRRRSKTRSRKRTVKVVKTLGLYHYAHKGETAWIEIFLGRIFARWERGLWLRLPLVRDFLLAAVLFHEIGHHIHTTIRPEFREREDVADRWQMKPGCRRCPPLMRPTSELEACPRSKVSAVRASGL